MSIIKALDNLSSNFPKSTAGPSVNFDSVSLTLSNNTILKDIDFKVTSGTIHCIIGPNGGGKTSLFRSLIGQMPHEGEISIEWQSENIIGYMPQMLDFDRTLPITVIDFMAMICQNRPAFLGLKKKRRKAIEMTLEAVGMQDKKNRIFGQLSGGEKQRILLAQALYPIPKLLLLDEPMAGVDDSFTNIFEEILYYCRDLGITILWINHDLSQVRKMADTVTCINKKILFSGLPEVHLADDKILNIFKGGVRQ